MSQSSDQGLNKKRAVLPLVALLALIFISDLISESKPPAAKGKTPSGNILGVEVFEAEHQAYRPIIDSFGTIKANTQTDLYPLVSGRVVSISPSLEVGATFAKGDVLLQIEQADYLSEVEIAKGELAQAQLSLAEERAKHAQARRDWEKQRNKESSQATELTLREPQLRAAQAALNSAQARLNSAELQVTRTTISAPYSGRTLNRSVSIGSVVSTNSLLAKIYASNSLEVRLPINNKDLAFLPNFSDSASVSVMLENSMVNPVQRWQAKIARTEAEIDSVSQQLIAIARVDVEDQTKQRVPLKLGQYVSAKISGELLEDVIVLPNNVIYQDSYVYKVKEGLLIRSDVRIAWRTDAESIVAEGVSPGDVIVRTPLGQLPSGTKVRILSDKQKAQE